MNEETFLYGSKTGEYLFEDEGEGSSASKSNLKSGELKLQAAKNLSPIIPFLRYRLDLTPIDRWNRTPLEDAETFGHTEVCNILKKAIVEQHVSLMQSHVLRD